MWLTKSPEIMEETKAHENLSFGRDTLVLFETRVSLYTSIHINKYDINLYLLPGGGAGSCSGGKQNGFLLLRLGDN